MKFLLYVCCLLMFVSCLTERPGSRNFASEKPVSASTVSAVHFGKTVYPLTQKYCSSCHGSELGEGPYQFPDDNDLQHKIVMTKQLVDITNVEDSALVQRLKTSHNCWSNCQENADEMEAAIRRWIPFLDKDLLAPEGYKTIEVGYLSGTEIEAEVEGRTARVVTYDLTGVIGSTTTISIQVEVEDQAIDGERKVYVKNIILNPTGDDVVVQDIKVLVETKAVAANVFSFVSDVISPTSSDEKKDLSQGTTGVIPVDEVIIDPRIQLVIKQLRVY